MTGAEVICGKSEQDQLDKQRQDHTGFLFCAKQLEFYFFNDVDLLKNPVSVTLESKKWVCRIGINSEQTSN